MSTIDDAPITLADVEAAAKLVNERRIEDAIASRRIGLYPESTNHEAIIIANDAVVAFVNGLHRVIAARHRATPRAAKPEGGAHEDDT